MGADLYESVNAEQDESVNKTRALKSEDEWARVLVVGIRSDQVGMTRSELPTQTRMIQWPS